MSIVWEAVINDGLRQTRRRRRRRRGKRSKGRGAKEEEQRKRSKGRGAKEAISCWPFATFSFRVTCCLAQSDLFGVGVESSRVSDTMPFACVPYDRSGWPVTKDTALAITVSFNAFVFVFVEKDESSGGEGEDAVLSSRK
jgi:hypothetical protein